jgi:hypothetical protein
VVERTGKFDFEAPISGYQSIVEFSMSKDAERWKNDFEAEYFVKLANGHYARMEFRITTGGDHFASIDVYYNPSGSRNLEYDPKKRLFWNAQEQKFIPKK